MAGEDLDAVAELDEPAQAVEEALGSLLRLDREIRPSRVADEERVAGEDEPRLVAARAVDHREAAVLRPVARRVDRAEDDLADLDLRPVLERLVRERRLRVPVHADRDAVLEREPSVTGDVIGVRVRLEHADEPDVAAFGLRQHRVDVVRRVDDDRDAGVLVADEVRGAAQIVVEELLEQHGATVPPASAMYPKAPPPGHRVLVPRVLLVEQPHDEPADREQEDERLLPVHQDPAEVLVADRRQAPEPRRVLVERVERPAGEDERRGRGTRSR